MRKHGRLILLSLILTITLILGLHLPWLSFDFEFEKFFPRNHPESLLYKQHVADFGYDNDFLQIILENEKSAFEADFIQKVSQLEKDLTEIKDVINIYSPLSLKHIVKTPTGLTIFPLIHTNDPDKLMRDSIRVFGNPLYRAAFGKDGKSMRIYLKHEHFSDPKRGKQILDAIQKKAASLDLEKIYIVGKLSASKVFIEYMQRDFTTYLMACLLLSYFLLALIFKSFKTAILPFLVSLISILWLFGFMSLMSVKVNLLSVLLPPIVFFVAMSDAIHLINAFSRVGDGEKVTQAKKAFKTVWTPTILTSLTTAIGFLSLLWINTEPVQYLGIFAAVGIVSALIISFTLGLLILPFLSRNKAIKASLPAGLTMGVIQKKSIIITLLIAVLLVAIPGISRLKVDAYLLEDLPKNTAIRQDFKFADQVLGGSKPFEIRVEVQDTSKSIWDIFVMNEIRKIETYLLDHYPVSNVQSPVTIIKYLHMSGNGGLNKNYIYPTTKKGYEKTLRIKNKIDPKRMSQLVTHNGKAGRLIGFIPELGTFETGKRNKKLKKYLNNHIDSSILSYQLTGTTYLIDKSHELLSENLIFGIGAAIFIIALILGFYFKSVRLLIISLIPNFIPLIFVAGIIGWLGIHINMTTAIVFAIVFGIAVDDTIHMISHYLQHTGSSEDRLKLMFQNAGNGIFITTLTISAGFAIFLFSSFGATYYLGLFIVLALLFAFIVDITLLPILLHYFLPQKDLNKR